MRTTTVACLSAMILTGAAGVLPEEAAGYPTKPITLVVTFPPGGGADTVARPLASVAHQHLGQPMIVINKAGGGGAVGAQFVANAKPDGYTVLYALNTVSEIPQVDQMLGRTPAFKKEQFIPIGQDHRDAVRDDGERRVALEERFRSSSTRRGRSRTSSSTPRPASTARLTSCGR